MRSHSSGQSFPEQLRQADEEFVVLGGSFTYQIGPQINKGYTGSNVASQVVTPNTKSCVTGPSARQADMLTTTLSASHGTQHMRTFGKGGQTPVSSL